MRFFDPSFFQLLYLLPFMMVLYFVVARRSRKRLQKILGERLAPFLTASYSVKKARIKFYLELVIVFFLVLTLARPQAGQSTQKEKSEGLEIVLLADVSPSMLAEDAKPSRLEQMKTVLKRFLDLTDGDKIGLVGLSGSSMLLSPLTNDKSALNMYLESLSIDSVSTRGTDFKKGIETAVQALERGGTLDEDDVVQNSSAARVIILASDGENHEGGEKEAIEILKKKGIRLFTLIIGTEKGAPIPIRDERGYLANYKQDRSGQQVISQARPRLMQELAEMGNGGSYFAGYDDQAIKTLKGDLDRLERGEFDTQIATVYDERFQTPLLLALLLSLVELLLGNRARAGRIWRGRFEIAPQ